MAYGSDAHALEAARRGGAVGVLGAALAVLQAWPALASLAPVPHWHCHRVTVVYQQPVGTPPPPMSWQVCENE